MKHFVKSKFLKVLSLGMTLLLIGGCVVGCSTTPPADPGDDSTTTTTEATVNEYKQLDYTAVEVGNDDVSAEALKKSYIQQGDLTRIKKLLEKAEKGEDLVIGAIGGSITEGILHASQTRYKYPQQVAYWFKQNFPKNKVSTVNAGIGSTNSIIGIGRAQEDLFSKNPDLIIIEFAVNDQGSAQEVESYEALVNRALNQPNQPAVILLFMGDENFQNRQAKQIPIGEKYDLPMISVNDAIKQGVAEGTYTWRDISRDNVHPVDRGYTLTADIITHRIAMVREFKNDVDDFVPAVPATTSRFMNVNMGNGQTFTPEKLGSFTPSTNMYPDKSLSKGWIATIGADMQAMEFDTTTKSLTLVYKTLTTPAATLRVYVDDKLAATINGKSNVSWEYANYQNILLRDKDEKVHIRLEASGVSGAEFKLLGIIQ